MRVELWRWNGDVASNEYFTPHHINFGNNIRGLRFRQHSVFISPIELFEYLKTHSKEELQRYLQDIEYAYKKE